MGDKERKKKELEKLYSENFKKLYRFFYYKTLDHSSAEDLTSETFLNFAEFIAKGNHIDNHRAFLYTIAKNVFFKSLRRKYNEITLDHETIDFYSYVEEILEIRDDESKFLVYVEKYLNELPSKQRIVLQMRFIRKMKIKTIAEELGKNINYVKTTQKRGLKKLRELLKR